MPNDPEFRPIHVTHAQLADRETAAAWYYPNPAYLTMLFPVRDGQAWLDAMPRNAAVIGRCHHVFEAAFGRFSVVGLEFYGRLELGECAWNIAPTAPELAGFMLEVFPEADLLIVPTYLDLSSLMRAIDKYVESNPPSCVDMPVRLVRS